MSSFFANETDSFGVAVAKTLFSSTVASAGTCIGLLAVGYGITKVLDIKENRKNKKNLPATV